jgi:hypothetical protein
MFEVIMIKGCVISDKITHFDDSDNVITSDNVRLRLTHRLKPRLRLKPSLMLSH